MHLISEYLQPTWILWLLVLAYISLHPYVRKWQKLTPLLYLVVSRQDWYCMLICCAKPSITLTCISSLYSILDDISGDIKAQCEDK